MRVRRPREEPEIPTASMADIAFLLIIFFMVTTVFAETRGINFRMPPPEEQLEETAPEAQREEAVSIQIEPSGDVLVDRQPMDREALDRDIVSYLLPKLERWPEKPILVTTDKDAPYGSFVEVYDALRQTEKQLVEDGHLPPGKSLTISILSLKDVERLKAMFGEDIFG